MRIAFFLVLFAFALFANPCMAGLDEGDEPVTEVFTPKWIPIPNNDNIFISLTGKSKKTEQGKMLHEILFKENDGSVYDDWMGQEGEDSPDGFSVSSKGLVTTALVRITKDGPTIVFITVEQ